MAWTHMVTHAPSASLMIDATRLTLIQYLSSSVLKNQNCSDGEDVLSLTERNGTDPRVENCISPRAEPGLLMILGDGYFTNSFLSVSLSFPVLEISLE